MSSGFRWFCLVSLCVGLVDVTGCSTTSPRSPAQSIDERDDGYPSPAECGDGQALTFQPVGFPGVERDDINLSGDQWSLVGQAPENDDSGYRLDLCIDSTSNAVSLQRMVRRVPQVSPFALNYIELRSETVVPSRIWESALGSGGDPSLEVAFVNQNAGASSILLKGWKTSSGEAFVTLSEYDTSSPDKLAATGSVVIYGKLVEGDPWITQFVQNDRLIQNSTISVEVRYKIKEGQNNYKTYRVESVKLTDSNPALPTPFSGEIANVDDPAQFQVEYSHHSLSDKFVIKFPHATYTIGGGVRAVYTNPAMPPRDFGIQCGSVYECGVPF